MLLALALACSCDPDPPAPAEPPPPARPNVLLLTLDTLRADALEIYGNTVSRTPVFNQLAQEGTRFSRAFTVTPLTIPAHSSLFTGLYPPRHGVRDNGDFFLGEEAVTLAERLKDGGYNTMAAVGAEVTSRHWGFAQGFDAFYDDMGVAADGAKNRWRVERPGDEVVRDALGWIDQHEDDEAPWFAWVHLFDAHHPYTSAPPEIRAHAPEQPYLGEVMWVDLLVGNLLAELERRGELEETLIVALADHGEGLGTHGEALHGVLLYNPTVRIPLIVRPPGGQENPGFVHFPVSAVDVLPTVLSYVGLEPAPDIDGLDLTPWIDAGDAPPDEPEGRGVYVESLYAFHHYGWAPQRAWATRELKLIDSTTPELYERADVFDATDLAETRAADLERLRETVRERAAAMEPVEGVSESVQLSPERLAQLEALGYITTDGGAASGALPEGDELLPDPVQRLPLLQQVEVARKHLQSGELEDAEAALSALIAEEPGLVEPRMMQTRVLSRLGRLEEALALAEATDAQVGSSGTRATLGQLRLDVGQIEEGLADLEASLAIDPTNGGTWSTWLHAIFGLGDPLRLETAVERAAEAVPDLIAVQAMTGHLMLLRGEFDDAEPLFQQVIERDPRLPLTRHALGLIARQRGDAETAERMFLDELDLYPSTAASRRQLVEIYVEQSRWAEQLAQLEPLATQDPTDPVLQHAIAQSLFNQGRYPESHSATRDCLSLAPAHAYCALLEANALKKLGRDDEALAAFERAKALRAAQ